jgi:D-alanyl-lipoteichoic acid acyltransferase DltB (MBOAT superfamily)
MLFHSFQFWAFMTVVGVVYWRLPHRGQNVFLLAASYFFYATWDWRFLSLILTSTTLDFFVARAIAGSSVDRVRRRYLLLSLCVNLGILGVFKYYGFFSTELTRMLAAVGIPASIPLVHLILPVGISFYTFQALSYTIDVYRGQMQPTNRFVDFALYISFFPQLVAGPIERSSHLLPQVMHPRTITRGDFSDGVHLVLLGLFKKVVIADNMAPIVNSIFSRDVAQLSGAECLMGVYAFAFQIYGDFSGYSSIAKGVAKWLGFDLMTNFSAPYLATSPQDFWRRWHISLSTWLRDYLYIPLGGNRGGRLFTYRNLLLTMLLGGLWH